MSKNTIKITDLLLHPTIGVYEAERENHQDIYVNLTIHHTRNKIEDKLDTTLDYDLIVKNIEEYAKTNNPYLIETFGEAIADICLCEATVTEVEIEIKKPAALKKGIVSVVIRKSNIQT